MSTPSKHNSIDQIPLDCDYQLKRFSLALQLVKYLHSNLCFFLLWTHKRTMMWMPRRVWKEVMKKQMRQQLQRGTVASDAAILRIWRSLTLHALSSRASSLLLALLFSTHWPIPPLNSHICFSSLVPGSILQCASLTWSFECLQLSSWKLLLQLSVLLVRYVGS